MIMENKQAKKKKKKDKILLAQSVLCSDTQRMVHSPVLSQQWSWNRDEAKGPEVMLKMHE